LFFEDRDNRENTKEKDSNTNKARFATYNGIGYPFNNFQCSTNNAQ